MYSNFMNIVHTGSYAGNPYSTHTLLNMTICAQRGGGFAHKIFSHL
jgi:hypothetical protein